MRATAVLVLLTAAALAPAQTEGGRPGGGTGGEGERSPFLARPDDGFYYSASNCCGLVAAYMVSNDLGKPVGLRPLARQLPVSSAGTSMQALADYFRSRGLGTVALEANTDQLSDLLQDNPQWRAVVLIHPNHWLTIRSAGGASFEAFSYPNWYTLGRAELEKANLNKVLLVSPQANMRLDTGHSDPWWVGAMVMLLAGGVVIWLGKRWPGGPAFPRQEGSRPAPAAEGSEAGSGCSSQDGAHR